jgi:hypothetical protein
MNERRGADIPGCPIPRNRGVPPLRTATDQIPRSDFRIVIPPRPIRRAGTARLLAMSRLLAMP